MASGAAPMEEAPIGGEGVAARALEVGDEGEIGGVEAAGGEDGELGRGGAAGEQGQRGRAEEERAARGATRDH